MYLTSKLLLMDERKKNKKSSAQEIYLFVAIWLTKLFLGSFNEEYSFVL